MFHSLPIILLSIVACGIYILITHRLIECGFRPVLSAAWLLIIVLSPVIALVFFAYLMATTKGRDYWAKYMAPYLPIK